MDRTISPKVRHAIAMDIAAAKNALADVVGPEELAALPYAVAAVSAPEIPFDTEFLRKHAGTHFLLFAPSKFKDGSPITINTLREHFGTDPSVSEPCFYNQDWYVKEDFSNTPLDGAWHLVRKEVLKGARGKSPEEIAASLSHEQFPTAVTYAFAFFAWWFHTGGEKLWKHDFVWCSDRDHNGDQIYVGRYEDPTGVNKSGFNIHRHLSLRPAYSAAPEIVPDV